MMKAFCKTVPAQKGKLRMAKVYITQVPHKHDRETDTFVPAVNISPATEHGELVIMMPPRTSFYATADLVKMLSEKLKDYSYENGDSIVSMGDPSVIAVAFALLGRIHGRFVVLKWDKNVGRYLPAHVSVLEFQTASEKLTNEMIAEGQKRKKK